MYGFHDWLEMTVISFLVYGLSTITTGWIHYTLLGISIFLWVMQLVIIIFVVNIYMEIMRKPTAPLHAETKQMLKELNKKTR